MKTPKPQTQVHEKRHKVENKCLKMGSGEEKHREILASTWTTPTGTARPGTAPQELLRPPRTAQPGAVKPRPHRLSARRPPDRSSPRPPDQKGQNTETLILAKVGHPKFGQSPATFSKVGLAKVGHSRTITQTCVRVGPSGANLHHLALASRLCG